MALFDPREMLKIAVMDEETGIAFYKSLAAVTRRPDVQSQCIAIGQQEEAHAQRFRNMLEGLGGYKPIEEYSGQYEEYLNALVESRAFPGPEEAAARARAARNDLDAIGMAIRLEMDTLAFFNEIKSALPPIHVTAVNDVMGEERNHLTELARLRRTLAAAK